MASEIPNDLIQKVQALLRKESGLSTYDPHDPSIHPLPSLDASISELDKSTPPEIPRCTKCNAKFLRGTKSLICIYCGSKKQDDNLPGPISFNSSSGCRWLLNSLDLDESVSTHLYVRVIFILYKLFKFACVCFELMYNACMHENSRRF